MLIDAGELLHQIGEMSPACREPQVFMDRPHCNCMVGIHGVKALIIEMMKRKLGNNATIEHCAE
jgi:hypothetical protein